MRRRREGEEERKGIIYSLPRELRPSGFMNLFFRLTCRGAGSLIMVPVKLLFRGLLKKPIVGTFHSLDGVIGWGSCVPN